MPYGTDRSALTPEITVAEGATVTPASGEVQDFTDTVRYRVGAPNGYYTTYRVLVRNLAFDTRISGVNGLVVFPGSPFVINGNFAESGNRAILATADTLLNLTLRAESPTKLETDVPGNAPEGSYTLRVTSNEATVNYSWPIDVVNPDEIYITSLGNDTLIAGTDNLVVLGAHFGDSPLTLFIQKSGDENPEIRTVTPETGSKLTLPAAELETFEAGSFYVWLENSAKATNRLRFILRKPDSGE